MWQTYISLRTDGRGREEKKSLLSIGGIHSANIITLRQLSLFFLGRATRRKWRARPTVPQREKKKKRPPEFDVGESQKYLNAFLLIKKRKKKKKWKIGRCTRHKKRSQAEKMLKVCTSSQIRNLPLFSNCQTGKWGPPKKAERERGLIMSLKRPHSPRRCAVVFTFRFTILAPPNEYKCAASSWNGSKDRGRFTQLYGRLTTGQWTELFTKSAVKLNEIKRASPTLC